jgi:PAS domain S-box-containing protein
MKKSSDAPENALGLRRMAELHLQEQPAMKTPLEAKFDAQRMMQELQIHQIELRLQNEELKASKAALDQSLSKYKNLYDFAPVGYFTLTDDGTIREVNLTGTCMVGVEHSLLVGRRFGLLLSAGFLETFNAFLKEIFASGIKQSMDFEQAEERTPYLKMSLVAKRLPNGHECHAMLIDTTKRQEAEDKLRISEIRYRRLFEAAKDGVLLLDPNTSKITDSNPFMTKLLGYSHDELVGKELYEIGLLKDETASREMFRKLKRTHQVRYEDLPLESQSGKHQQVEVVANLYDEAGRSVIQCNIRDITKRKQAEDILRRNGALFSALIEQAPLGVYVVDAAFCLQQVNTKAMPIFAKIHPFIGRKFSELVHLLWPKRTADKIEKQFRHTLTSGEPYQSPEFSGRRQDTGVHESYDWQLQRVTLPSGEHGVVCFFENITERKAAESAQRRLDIMTASNEKLKLEIIQREAAEVALSQSEQRALHLLEESQKLQKQLRQMSHQMLLVQETQRKEISHELHDKISQVLIGINVQLAVFTKAATLNPQGVAKTILPVRKLVEKSVKIVHEFARELRPSMLDDLGLIPALRDYIEGFPKRNGLKIHFTAFAGVEALDNNQRTMLYRVVQEALVNVSKHAKATSVKVIIRKLRGGVELEVSDNGKAFEVRLLTSTKWSKRLGLSGMRERVEMLSGKFTVKSVAGKGTTILALIPSGKSKAVK